MRSRRQTVGLLISFSALAGCSGYSGPTAEIEKTVPAAGVVTFRGQPLEHYQVLFFPGEGRRPAAGMTDAQGRFTLGTNQDGDGAAPGSHKVAIVYVGPPSNQEAGREEYIEPPPPKVPIPDKYSNPETSGLTQNVPEDGSDDLKIDLQ